MIDYTTPAQRLSRKDKVTLAEVIVGLVVVIALVVVYLART